MKVYNTAALALVPPREPLDWSRVSHYGFLEEFHLLQESHRDIRQEPWAQPVIKEMIKQSLRIKRAHEEIIRCNIEIRRLHTSIVDEDLQFKTILADLRIKEDALLGPVEDYCVRRSRVNSLLLERIYDIYDLKGFSGVKSPGVRKGGVRMVRVDMERNTTDQDSRDEDSGDEDDEAEEDAEIGGLVDFISSLTA